MDDGSTQRWLDEFALAVRRRDFAVGRRLFDPGVVGFGTFADHVSDLRSLEHEQWRQVWERTSDFAFDAGSATVVMEGGLACVAVRWRSNGLGDRGEPIVRLGRATIVLRRGDDDSWRAVHTHFSLSPEAVVGRPASRIGGASSDGSGTAR